MKLTDSGFSLSTKLRYANSPGSIIRGKLGQKMTDPNWFYVEADKELSAKEAKKKL